MEELGMVYKYSKPNMNFSPLFLKKYDGIGLPGLEGF
jgi:hypothetical protein